MLTPFKDKTTEVSCFIGYGIPGKNPIVFEGAVEGRIVSPRGVNKFEKRAIFGFDPIFEPRGYKKTYAEMTIEEKNTISHR